MDGIRQNNKFGQGFDRQPWRDGLRTKPATIRHPQADKAESNPFHPHDQCHQAMSVASRNAGELEIRVRAPTAARVETTRNVERRLQNPVAAEVMRLKLQDGQRIGSLLTSAATGLKETLDFTIPRSRGPEVLAASP